MHCNFILVVNNCVFFQNSLKKNHISEKHCNTDQGFGFLFSTVQLYIKVEGVRTKVYDFI